MAEKLNTKQFSVIIPTRNRETYLAQAVASVLGQEDVSLELLLINDGDALAMEFSDARVKIFDNQKRTAVPARNLGVEQATGAAIAFLDDDDFWIDTGHLRKAAEHFAQGTDFYFADGEMLFPDGTRKAYAQTATRDSLAHDNTILISAACYRRNLHDALGLFDVALPYYWDWDWYLRVARSGARLYHQRDPAVCIRIHDQNMSGQNVVARQSNLQALTLKHRLENIPLKNHTVFL